MKFARSIWTWLGLLVLLLAAGGADSADTSAANGSLRAELGNGGCTIFKGETTLLHYQAESVAMDENRQCAHFIHPLAGLDGETITHLFPRDHVHHRGIFWGWHQLTVAGEPAGNTWTSENIVWENEGIRLLEGPAGQVGFETSVLWKSPLWRAGAEPIVRETLQVRVHPDREGARMIDFRITLQALTEDVRLGGAPDVKGYGGFCARVIHPEQAVFSGRPGVLAAQNEGVETGPWMNLSGTRNGQPYAVAILQHPTNPGHPQPSLLRNSYKGATSGCQNAIWPGREPVLLPTETPVVLRYRLLLHGGADAAEAWAQYAAEP